MNPTSSSPRNRSSSTAPQKKDTQTKSTCNTCNTKPSPETRTSVTSVRLPSKLLQTARELGLNISKISENALLEAVEKLKKPLSKTMTNGALPESGRSLVWLGHQPATLTTRVQIPATAPIIILNAIWAEKRRGQRTLKEG